eukprot:UN11780
MVGLQSHLLLIIYCMVSCINASRNGDRNDTVFRPTLFRPETSANFVPNDNIRDEQNSILISTFFDLFWYIIGLLVFCICCISCLLLFYLQQTKKYNSSIKSQMSVSESLQYCESRHIDPQSNITTPSRKISNKSNNSNISNISCGTGTSRTSLTSVSCTIKSLGSQSQTPTHTSDATVPSLPSKSSTSTYQTSIIDKHTAMTAYSLSAFSGVDSEGVDMDNNNVSVNIINLFQNLGPIADEFEPSQSSQSSQSSKTFNEPP